jgi:hypothetical protein
MAPTGFPLRLGSTGPDVLLLDQKAVKRFASYAFEADGVTPLKADGYFGKGEQRFVETWQARSKLPVTGQLTEAQFHALTGPGTQSPAGGTTITKRRKIWIYTAPGSGANWDQGPSFQLGIRAERELRLNHQPVSFQKGGYLGFMGGDPKFSYVDVTWDQYLSLRHLLEHCPDINDPEWEGWFSGYSQSADGMEDALEMLFGDGGFVHPGDPTQTPAPPGPFRHLRGRINGVVQFGNPATKRTGIARKVRPGWLDALIRNVNYPNDFYAVAADKIRPPMYAVIIKAEMELPFFVHVLRLAARIIPDWLTFLPIGQLTGGLLGGGVLGSLLGGGNGASPFGALGTVALGSMTGLGGNNPALGGLMSLAGTNADQDVDDQLYDLLKPTGVLTSIPDMIGLVGALPGLQAHGGYEFDPVKMNEAFGHLAAFRR